MAGCSRRGGGDAVLVLSGGTGTVKLVRGLDRVGVDFCVVVNAAEDVEVSGNLVCPDVDSVLYGLAGCLGEDLWGVAGDTFVTHERLAELGGGEFMRIGDRDRATHAFRSELMRGGASLTEAVGAVAEGLGVTREVFPMSDDRVETYVGTGEEWLHFQEFWVREGGEPRVESVELRGVEGAEASPRFREALEREEVVVIGPSNPVTSIGPILALPGVREGLENKNVVAVSPIIGDEPVSGPVGKLLEAEGFDASSEGVEEYYGGVVDLFVTDVRDSYGEVELDTLMRSGDGEERFAGELVELLEGKGWL